MSDIKKVVLTGAACVAYYTVVYVGGFCFAKHVIGKIWFN